MRVPKLESLLSREDLSHALFLSVAVWVADATYAGTDALQKRTLRGSANQRWFCLCCMLHGSQRLHAHRHWKKNRFHRSIDVCGAAAADPTGGPRNYKSAEVK